MLRAVFCSKDLRNAHALTAVAREFRTRGVAVRYLLDLRGSAWTSYERDENFQAAFQDMDVQGMSSTDGAVDTADFCFVSLSSSGEPNLETSLCRRASDLRVPVFGLEDIPGGRNNPSWRIGNTASPLCSLRRLFTVMPSGTDEKAGVPVTVVGPLELATCRSLDVQAVGTDTRKLLGVSESTPVVYYAGQPCSANPFALFDLGEALWSLRERIPGVVLIVSRHRHDKGIDGNGAAHRHALRYIQEHLGIRAIEHSWHHQDISSGDPDSIPRDFRPPVFVPLTHLMCACKDGMIVTGFEADVLPVASYMGVPSVLYLNPLLFGGFLKREKGVSGLSLPAVPEVSTVKQLAFALEKILGHRPGYIRESRLQELAEWYQVPEKDPEKRITDIVLCRELEALRIGTP